MTFTDLVWSLLPFATFAAGYALARIEIAHRERKATDRQGFVGAADFSWPGRPMRIVDAEVLTPDDIDTAVRGD